MHATLRLTNTSQAVDVLYRVQTTSPAIYRVRPSHGRIPAGGANELQVVMVMDPVKADKFLIKYVTVSRSLPQGDFTKQFSEAESTSQEHRLKVSVVGEIGPNESSTNITSPNFQPTRADSVGSEKGTTLFGDSLNPDPATNSPLLAAMSGASLSSLPTRDLQSMTADAIAAELKEARAKISLLAAKNQELSKVLDDSKVPNPSYTSLSHPPSRISASAATKTKRQSTLPPS